MLGIKADERWGSQYKAPRPNGLERAGIESKSYYLSLSLSPSSLQSAVHCCACPPPPATCLLTSSSYSLFVSLSGSRRLVKEQGRGAVRNAQCAGGRARGKEELHVCMQQVPTPGTVRHLRQRLDEGEVSIHTRCFPIPFLHKSATARERETNRVGVGTERRWHGGGPSSRIRLRALAGPRLRDCSIVVLVRSPSSCHCWRKAGRGREWACLEQ